MNSRIPLLEARWRRAALGLTPGFLYATHLTAGANQMVAAQGFSLILALALCAALTMSRARRELADLKPLWLLLGLFAAVLLAATLAQAVGAPASAWAVWRLVDAQGVATINRSATWLEMVKLCGLACVFALGCLHGASGERARSTIERLVLLGGIYAALSIALFLAGFQVRGRLSGGFLSANSGATVFGMLIVIAASFMIRQLRRTARLSQQDRFRKLAVPVGSLFLMAVCLVLTASRMGLAATVVAVSGLLIWEFGSRRAAKMALRTEGVVLLGAGVALVAGAALPLWGRVGQLDEDTSIRGLIFSTHWRAFLDAPLLGHGLGAFSDINSQLLTPDNYAALWSIRAAHNVYIQWLEEMGLVGAVPMFALVSALILISARRIGSMKSGQTLARGLVASSLVVLVHGTVDYALQVPSIAAFWAFMLGLQFAFGQNRS